MTDQELEALMRQRGGLLSPNDGVMQGGSAAAPPGPGVMQGGLADDPQIQLHQLYQELLPQMKTEQGMLNLRRWYMQQLQNLQGSQRLPGEALQGPQRLPGEVLQGPQRLPGAMQDFRR